MKSIIRVVLMITALLLSSSDLKASVVIETVPVGNVGNAGEWSGEDYATHSTERICGAVGYEYRIGKYEVTAGQYTEFLNSVATTDNYGLYNDSMNTTWGGCRIIRTGTSGSYEYSVSPDWANRPVNFVSWGDAARFTNWMHNGQGNGNTETGSYDLSDTHSYYGLDGSVSDEFGLRTALATMTRETNATWVIPSEDEWYKAAYHKNDGVTDHYYDYATSSDSVPSNDLVDPDPGNNATYYLGNGDYTIGSPYVRTEVGAHENSESPYGTFDQGGNVHEWTATELNGPYCVARGGSFGYGEDYLRAEHRVGLPPSYEYDTVGFRLAYIPEPATVALLALGGMAALRRR